MTYKHPHRLLLNYNRICPICGKSFYSKSLAIKFCSDKCRKINAEQKRQEYNKKNFLKNKENHYCKTCGQLITAKHRYKYCSNECVQIANKYKIKKKQRHKRYCEQYKKTKELRNNKNKEQVLTKALKQYCELFKVDSSCFEF